jgi:signal transduction histidine kinase
MAVGPALPLADGASTSHRAVAREGGFPRWPWMLLTALVLGPLSVALLVWVERINDRQIMHFALANTVMDFRIRVALAQLWIGKITIAANPRLDQARAADDLREVARLARLLLNGGESEYGLIASPLRELSLRRRAQDLERLVSEWETLTTERIRRAREGQEGSALEAQSDRIANELQARAAELERLVETDQASDIVRSRRLFYGLLVFWSCILAASATSLLHAERQRRSAEASLRLGHDQLERRVAERTRELRSVNSQLLTAQETERRRISTELHDDLGHSLIMMKFRCGLIARGLRDDHDAVQQECQALAQFIDHTIEDVRRLSRDLRPSVLEELGLSAALRWLVESCRREGHTVREAIGEVDHLLSRHAQVVLYRIVQQALANAGKHSEARNVWLRVEWQRDRLSFVVEDDGRGFDIDEVSMRHAGEKGLGLATMRERTWMLGGSLEIWSEVGAGTRITVTVPVEEGWA